LWSLAKSSPPISDRESEGTVRPCRPSFGVGVVAAAAAGAAAAVVGARMRAMDSVGEAVVTLVCVVTAVAILSHRVTTNLGLVEYAPDDVARLAS
jgi:ABC-type uncharacterized transport system permease subunit